MLSNVFSINNELANVQTKTRNCESIELIILPWVLISSEFKLQFQLFSLIFSANASLACEKSVIFTCDLHSIESIHFTQMATMRPITSFAHNFQSDFQFQIDCSEDRNWFCCLFRSLQLNIAKTLHFCELCRFSWLCHFR